MKIITTTLISLCLLGSSAAFADRNHYDVAQDEFWHGAETAPMPIASPSEKASASDDFVDHYDVAQDEFWHGG